MIARRTGAALIVVLVALALLGFLASAGVFATTLRVHADRERSNAPAAEALAESLAVATLVGWSGPTAARVAAGDTLDSLLTLGAASARLRIVPVARGRYVVTVAVERGTLAGARAGVWLAARRDATSFGALPAVSSPTPLALLGEGAILDDDRSAGDSLGCLPGVSPSPSSPDDSASAMQLDSAFRALQRHAELRLEVGSSAASLAPAPRRRADARCDALDASNWGEPDAAGVAACAAYLPVVAVAGSLRLDGGRGQGTLVVDGDLEMRGDARFTGLVLVRGYATLADDATIVGALVLLGDATGGELRDRASVRRSGCAVARASAATGPPKPDGAHAWAPLY